MTHAYLPLSLLPVAAICAVAEPQEQSVQNQNVEDIISFWEDMATALDDVRDVTDADLVATRVALDILLIREWYGDTEATSGADKAVKARAAAAAKTAATAVARVKAKHYYESDALKAAVQLLPLVDPAVKPGASFAPAVAELRMNCRETIIELLEEVDDAESADIVAKLVDATMICCDWLDELADEIGDADMDEEQELFIERRMDSYEADLKELKTRLKKEHFYGSVELKTVLD